MSEELLGGNQTTTEPVTQEPITTQQLSQTQEPSTQPQENVFTVKYNKEEMKIPYEQAPDYIQKGLNYDKVSQRVNEYETHLNRVAQLTGYSSHEEMIKALDQAEQEQQQQYYRDKGIDPEAVTKLLESHPDIQYARQMKQQQEEQQRFQKEADEFFAEFPDLKADQIPKEVWQLKEQKGLSLLDSYLRVSYKSLGQQKEQEAIQKLQGNAQASPGALGSEGVNHIQSVSNLSSKDFNSLVEQVLRGERKQL